MFAATAQTLGYATSNGFAKSGTRFVFSGCVVGFAVLTREATQSDLANNQP
jgi:hypothetical protein